MCEKTATAAQVAVIGALLIDSATHAEVFRRVRPEDFTDELLRATFEAARDMYDSQQAGDRAEDINPVTLLGALRRRGYAEAEVRQSFSAVMDATPSTAGTVGFCQQLLEETRLRKAQTLGLRLIDANSDDELRDAFDRLGDVLQERDRTGKDAGSDLHHLLLDFLQEQEKPAEHLKLGLGCDIDRALLLRRGQMFVLGARPSVGKTAMGIQLGAALARTQRVGFFSLETSKQEITDRYVSCTTGADFGKVQNHKLVGDPDFTRVSQAMHLELQRTNGGKNWLVYDASGWDVRRIRDKVLQDQLDVIIVDYLQIIRPDDKKSRSMEEAVASVSIALRELARGLEVAVIVLAQMSREAEKAGYSMSGLRNSGQIEQDADKIVLLTLDDPDDRTSDRLFTVVKNKQGHGGQFRFRFVGREQRFVGRE